MSGTLISPGVKIQIIDESFYGSSGPGTVPLIVIATAANKAAPSGSGIAAMTAPSQAGTLFLATSQLELTTNYGVPYFATLQGTVLQGNETNEWGLHAAYSYLGISNRAFILRADIDTSQLTASAVPPVGPPIAGQYWLDLSDTVWGVFQANGNSVPGAAWVSQTVLIPTASQVDSNNVPLTSFGKSGNYAIVPWVSSNFLFQKGTPYGTSTAAWYLVGSTAWYTTQPLSIVGSVTPTTFTSGGQITINGVTVTVDALGVTGTVSDVITAITNAAIPNIIASQSNGALLLINTAGGSITIADVDSSGICAAMGITAAAYNDVSFYQTSDPQYPNGSVQGSVWIKGNPSRGGAAWDIKYYNSASAQWITLSAPFYPFDSTLADGYTSKDTAASSALGIVSTGSVYIGYDPNTGVQQPRRWNGTYWAALSYVASYNAPTTPPVAGTLWFNSSSSFIVDLMVCTGNEWIGYRNAYPLTDPNGIQISGSAPTTQSNGNVLQANDLWLDSADSDNYPLLYRWNALTLRWNLIDKTDHESPFGITFADARQNSGVAFTNMPNPGAYNYNSTAMADLLLSDYVEPDAPNPELFPAGLLLFNTRASNNTVMNWLPTYFQPGSSPTNFDPNDDYTVNSYTVGNTSYVFPPLASAGRWVNAAGNDSANNLLPFMGRKAQRHMIVKALEAVIIANQDIRSELVYYNLIACPGYCELINAMSGLNTDQQQVSFIVADTPMRLTPDSNSLINWANNKADVAYTTEDGLAPGDYSGAAGDYIGLYYPWGLGTDLSGNQVMVPPSTVALSTIAYSDQVSYVWFAPAGFTRGLVTNVSSVGYLTSDGSFKPVILNPGQRDTLYGYLPTGCQINPIAYMPGRGLVVFGQITLNTTSSALNRINVARLVCYLKYQLAQIVKPYLFEQNDSQTQKAAYNTVSVFLNSLVGLRAISDYAVKCDSDNNTPDRINQNELWIDCAIVPLHAIEFIYIPVRILAASTSAITYNSSSGLSN
ncbi:unnamed protein product [Sphagnum tenellum]